MRSLFIILYLLSGYSLCKGQQNRLIDPVDMAYIAQLTKTVMDSARIVPGQFVSNEMGANNTGGTLIRPGGRNAYPSFWIRDYAMSLETGFVTLKEQWHMLQLAAATQCDQAWITKGGSMVPAGSIADHIRIDDALPVYFPGTYSYEGQGVKEYGMLPPYCDQFYFIHMAHYYLKTSGQNHFLGKLVNGKKLIDRLELAFSIVPADPGSQLAYTNDAFRAVDFGFRDAISITGKLCFSSLLKYQAARQLAAIFRSLKKDTKATAYDGIADSIKAAIVPVFMDNAGFLRAATEKSAQPDVWSTALAVYLGVLKGALAERASVALASTYKAGYIAYKGNIRHVPVTGDFSNETAWEHALIEKGRYQNGAYWGTPTGWVAYAISITDSDAAKRLVKEYIDNLRENDFRKGGKAGAPYECFNADGYTQNPLYLTTVSVPYIVFKSKNR